MKKSLRNLKNTIIHENKNSETKICKDIKGMYSEKYEFYISVVEKFRLITIYRSCPGFSC